VVLNEFRFTTRCAIVWISSCDLCSALVLALVESADKLFPLYALISPFEFLNFHVRNRWQRLRRALRPLPTAPRAPRVPLSFRRIKRLAPADIALAAEAACMLTFFRAALKFPAHAKLTAWMGRYDQSKRRFHPRWLAGRLGACNGLSTLWYGTRLYLCVFSPLTRSLLYASAPAHLSRLFYGSRATRISYSPHLG